MHAEERQQQVADLVGFTRSSLAGRRLAREALAAIAGRLEALANRGHLWAEAAFPSPTLAERQKLYLIGEEADRSFAVYLSVMCQGRRVPPHNHTTWACIAAVEGCEHNYLYRRLDDGSEPGHAQLEEIAVVRCESGRAMSFMAEDIHAVANTSSPMARHLHFYGSALEILNDRVIFDLAAGTCRPMVMEIPSTR